MSVPFGALFSLSLTDRVFLIDRFSDRIRRRQFPGDGGHGKGRDERIILPLTVAIVVANFPHQSLTKSNKTIAPKICLNPIQNVFEN